MSRGVPASLVRASACLVTLILSVAVARGDEVISRPVTLQTIEDLPLTEPGDAISRVLTAQNLFGIPVPVPDQVATRSVTVRNFVAEMLPLPDEAIARSVTVQNQDFPALFDAALARALTLQNVISLVGDEPTLGRALTVQNLDDNPFALPEQAVTRTFTLQNIVVSELPGSPGEAIGRAFTVQNIGEVVDVAIDPDGKLPGLFRLYPAVPNPSLLSASIRYDLPRPSPVSLRVFDVAGRLVRTLVDSPQQPAGSYSVRWRGRDDDGRNLPSGVYFYRMKAASFQEDRRLVLMRQ